MDLRTGMELRGGPSRLRLSGVEVVGQKPIDLQKLSTTQSEGSDLEVLMTCAL